MSIVDERRMTHGDPVANVEAIAEAWSEPLGFQVTPLQVCECMERLHRVRHQRAPVHDPAHLEHAEGYMEIAEMIRKRDDEAFESRLP